MRIKKSIFQICWVVLVLTALSNCRKTDQSAKDKADVIAVNVQAGRFFSDYLPGEPLARAIREFVIREDQRYHFSEEYLKKLGTPRWDKVLSFYNSKNGIINHGDDPPDSTISYVPFVKGTQIQINAALVVRTVNNDTTFRILYAREYDDPGFGETINRRPNPRDIFHLFASMEKAVFGTKRFSITDERLLTTNERAKMAAANLNWNDIKVIYTIDSQSDGQHTNKALIVERCDVIAFCMEYGLKAFRTGQQSPQISTSNTGPPCIAWGTYTECWTQWIEIPDYGGTGGSGDYSGEPGSGGAGSGSGNWPSPVDPTPCEDGVGRVAELCEGPGWEPLPASQVLAFGNMLAPGDDFEYDVLTDPSFQTFNSLYEFQAYKNNIGDPVNTTYDLSTPPTIINQQEKIKRARFNLNLIGGVDVDLKMEKVNNLWKIKEVDSDTWGFTPATTWKQGVYNQSLNGNEIIVEVNGKLHYNVIIQGIGTIYKQAFKFRIKINNITGEIISISRI